MKKTLLALSFVFAAASAGPALAQDPFATQVVSYTQGSGAGIFLPSNILGGPLGGGLSVGSLNVCSLGTGGQITLGFAVQIADGPGADLSVFENGFFVSATMVYSETAFVEVSTDGVNFVRFPSRYAGPPGPLPMFGGAPVGSFSGLTGGLPVVSNVLTNAVSPFDPAVSGGEAFDLADLAGLPQVISGAVDIHNIHFVRLVDAVSGVSVDSFGNFVWDNGGAGGNADIDAVAVLCHAGNNTPTRPVADLFWDAQGRLNLKIGDPNGVADLDLSKLHASYNLIPLNISQWLSIFSVVSYDGNIAWLRTPFSFNGTGLRGAFAVSVEDLSGERSGDQSMIQG